MVQLRFREVDRDLFQHVRDGRKRYELRANTTRFKDVSDGDPVTVVCGDDVADMRAKKTWRFSNLDKVFQTIPVTELMPDITDDSVVIERINGFPEYAKKIRDHGIVVIELEKA